MGQSTIVPRRSSPCCIGCVLGIVVVLCFGAALGIYVYRFIKNNVTIIEVMAKDDPPLDTPGEVLMPERAGDFERVSLDHSLDAIAGMADVETSGAVVAVYSDGGDARLTVVALSTADVEALRPTGFGGIMMTQGSATPDGRGVSILDPYSDSGVITTWSRTNWTFMVQTTSSLTGKFVEEFNPGEGSGASAVDVAPVAVEETPVAADEPVDAGTTAAVPVAVTPGPDAPVTETVVGDGVTSQ